MQKSKLPFTLKKNVVDSLFFVNRSNDIDDSL